MNQTYPTFSVITPSYNQGEYIESTINSVISQEGEFFIEYIIMDGGSTDNSVNIIKKYDSLLKATKYPIKCRGVNFSWISQKDNGQYGAINKGFSISSGEIMSWINSDDMYLPFAFKTIAMIFQKFLEVQWIIGYETIIDKQCTVIDINTSRLYPRSLLKKGLFNGKDGPFIQQESTFWRRSLWKQLKHKLNIQYKYAADFELWTSFAEKAELVKVNTQIGAFRKHDRQKTNALARYYKETDSIRRVSFPNKIYIRLTILLSRIYFLDKFFLLKDQAYLVYFSCKKQEWLMKKVMGRINMC